MERIASCMCVDLSIRVKGDPTMTAACNCTKCQKRTGSVFSVGAYFKAEQVIEPIGNGTEFTTRSAAGRSVTQTFCPRCGSTVYWVAEFQPNQIGIAVGCFADPDFPEPMATVWNGTKHNWVSFPPHWPSSDTQEFN
ncbi:GFA family protein [filamentous cyanobacterium LEGE 11480]|uniref:GFA family protein n=1 Tax=Romeriopsis navalis LEGE 11480 TaxID=2777977 RepID=A0A928VKQ2_9CYAN|nr:GFA family protein [Romeriopsis navalis]MBE9030351.1 GFA family protein [Romeriopsis navalis LEGE 11480]